MLTAPRVRRRAAAASAPRWRSIHVDPQASSSSSGEPGSTARLNGDGSAALAPASIRSHAAALTVRRTVAVDPGQAALAPCACVSARRHSCTERRAGARPVARVGVDLLWAGDRQLRPGGHARKVLAQAYRVRRLRLHLLLPGLGLARHGRGEWPLEVEQMPGGASARANKPRMNPGHRWPGGECGRPPRGLGTGTGALGWRQP